MFHPLVSVSFHGNKTQLTGTRQSTPHRHITPHHTTSIRTELLARWGLPTLNRGWSWAVTRCVTVQKPLGRKTPLADLLVRDIQPQLQPVSSWKYDTYRYSDTGVLCVGSQPIANTNCTSIRNSLRKEETPHQACQHPAKHHSRSKSTMQENLPPAWAAGSAIGYQRHCIIFF